jgi:hypothetical protein
MAGDLLMAMIASASRFSPDDTYQVMLDARARVGLGCSESRLLRLGENAIYALDVPDVVVRVARSVEMLKDVRKEVGVARWLASLGYPAVRLAELEGVDQPIVVASHPVTFWRLIRPIEPKPSASDLGRLLRWLHGLKPPESLLPEFRPFARVADRLDEAPRTVEQADLDFLCGRLDTLHREYEELSFVFPPGPVHGDAHPGNLLRTSAGEVVLLDFEQFCHGPREWDLSLAWAYRHAFGWFTAEEYGGFVEAYGYDIAGWPGLPVLRSIRELGMTTWLMQMVDHDAAKAEEFRRRVADMRAGHGFRRWRPF